MSLRPPFILLLIGALFFFCFDQKLVVLISPYLKTYQILFKGCTLFIFPPLYLFLSAGGYVVARLKKSPLSLPLFVILITQCLSVSVVRIFKVLLGRVRPDFFLKTGLYGFYGFDSDHHFHSFPSGHSMAALTLATSLSLLFPHYRTQYFLVFGGLSLSRIFLLGHFPSDVIGTAAVALLIGKGIYHLILYITRNHLYETI